MEEALDRARLNEARHALLEDDAQRGRGAKGEVVHHGAHAAPLQRAPHVVERKHALASARRAAHKHTAIRGRGSVQGIVALAHKEGAAAARRPAPLGARASGKREAARPCVVARIEESRKKQLMGRRQEGGGLGTRCVRRDCSCECVGAWRRENGGANPVCWRLWPAPPPA